MKGGKGSESEELGPHSAALGKRPCDGCTWGYLQPAGEAGGAGQKQGTGYGTYVPVWSLQHQESGCDKGVPLAGIMRCVTLIASNKVLVKFLLEIRLLSV